MSAGLWFGHVLCGPGGAAVLGGSFLLPEVPSLWAACCATSTTRSFVVLLLLRFPDSDEGGIAQTLLPKFLDFFSHRLWAQRLEKGKTRLFSHKGKFQSNGSSKNKEQGRERWGLSAGAAALLAPSYPALAAPRAWCCARCQFLLGDQASAVTFSSSWPCVHWFCRCNYKSQPRNLWGLVTLLFQMPVWVVISF